ncbi:lipoprotein NlpI, contains TPR repeats [Belliella baltica DSM 15883]|uniref:Lipoprotein NlpI, contains TPR repeats n=1 Tax=Belliella baltica (strain DSM 15883 / CIP 108006 / LMG 21964 / BA134) TaxID=866536 RepID=I3Z1S0_BELBD|nr:tetratricopeptide repeat protein [Belliella baltica]AFL83188.1 lipoprotein NlpI, contains TPR repeats [Belliella baltica DSM 15883]
MNLKSGFFVLLLLIFVACSGRDENIQKSRNNFIVPEEKVFQATSLLGDSLFTIVDSVSQKDQLVKLQDAEDAYSDNSTLENLIWIGRREAYLSRYDLAIRTFTKAISEHPDAYEPYRHRGHRYISIRKFDKAIEDFNTASQLMEGVEIQIEEDGMPNKLNIPLSNIQFNVWYHLGLAHYLKADWENALKAYQECLKVSNNDDLIVATLDWYYMTLQKLGRDSEARELLKSIKVNMEIIENDAYFKRLLLYKGKLTPEALLSVEMTSDEQKLQYVTQGYGLGNYYLSQGDTSQAKSIFQNVIKTGYWSAFGYIASEMELAKLLNE